MTIFVSLDACIALISIRDMYRSASAKEKPTTTISVLLSKYDAAFAIRGCNGGAISNFMA